MPSIPPALQMALLPRWSVTRRLTRSPLVLAPLALVYGLLLVWSWQPDTLSLILPGSLADGLKGELKGGRAAVGRWGGWLLEVLWRCLGWMRAPP